MVDNCPGWVMLAMECRPIEILLVDSNASDADLYRRILARCWPAANLTWLSCLESALGYLSRRSTGAILLDLHLPDSSGLQTLASLHPWACSVPIVVLTEFDDGTQGLEAGRSGSDHQLLS